MTNFTALIFILVVQTELDVDNNVVSYKCAKLWKMEQIIGRTGKNCARKYFEKR